MNLRFYLFVPGVNERNAGGRLVQDFLVLPRGFGSFPQSFCERGGACRILFFFFVFKIYILSVTIYKGNSFYRRLM